ncbi:maker184, partial [Drosophila busckii]
MYLFTEHCRQLYDSRVNKSGSFESSQLLSSITKKIDSVAVAVQCRYEFEAQSPERIQVKFHDFNIPTEHENSTRCQDLDALHVLSKVGDKYETQELLCGAFLPKPIMSTGQALQLQFVGKYPPTMTNKVQYYGFRAEYRFLTNFGIVSGEQQGNDCTFVYNSSDRISGLFHSPNFPGYYLENVVCNYYFYGDNERIVIRFTFFDVEGIPGSCDFQTASDYVEFSNFMSTDRKYKRYCGKLPDFEVRSDGRFFRVTFHSNDRFVANGFRALYTFERIKSRIDLDLESNSVSMQSYVSDRSNAISIASVEEPDPSVENIVYRTVNERQGSIRNKRKFDHNVDPFVEIEKDMGRIDEIAPSAESTMYTRSSERLGSIRNKRKFHHDIDPFGELEKDMVRTDSAPPAESMHKTAKLTINQQTIGNKPKFDHDVDSFGELVKAEMARIDDPKLRME